MRVPKAIGIPAVSITLAFFGAAVVAPLIAVLIRASDWSALLDPGVLATVRATIWQAAWSTAISATLGLPLGLWVGSLSPARTGLARALLSIPFGVPTLVAAAAWVVWFGRSGWLARLGIEAGANWAYSLRAVILAHVFLNLPWVALLVAHSRMQVSSRLLEAAAVQGAGWFSRLRFILWPEVKWALASAAVQVFGLCAMSFALVLVLGGGPPVETLETALYSRIRYGSLDIEGAAACAAWELLLTLTPWVILMALRYRGQASFSGVLPSEGQVPANQLSKDRFWGIFAALMCALLVVPYASTWVSAPPWGLLRSEALPDLLRPLQVSVGLASVSAAGSVAIAALGLLAAAFARSVVFVQGLVLTLMSIPAGVSVLVTGLGFWFLYGRWVDPFSGSWLAIVVLQTALFAPIALRVLWPIAQGMRPRLLEAAATLGASPVRAFFWVEWPRWKFAVLSSFALVAAASLGEVAAVSLFQSEELTPLALLVSRWMGQYRFQEAEALAGLLLLLAGTAIGLTGLLERQAKAESRRPV